MVKILLANSKKSILKDLIIISADLKKIIIKCMAQNPQNRYENVSQLKKELSACKNQKKSLIVAILGSQTRIGVTHIAIGMVSYLNKHGIKAIYEEKNNNGVISSLYDVNDFVIETNGIYRLKDFEAIPDYNNTICIDKSAYDVIVLDCKSDSDISKEFRTADVKLVVLGTKEWELEHAREYVNELKDMDVQYIFNLCKKKQAYQHFM